MADKIKAVIREVGKITAAVGGRDTTPAKWRGKWQPEERYGTLHKVEHLGSSYVCIKACVGVDPEADVTLGNGVEGSCWILIAKRGEDGEAFTYDMFTEEQLEALRGPEGPQGVQGIQGIPGERGAQGVQGIQGIQGERGAQGERGERGAAFTYDMFTEAQLEGLRGPKGPRGYSPTVNATPTSAGVQFTIKNYDEASGMETITYANVKNGDPGLPGSPGAAGAKGDSCNIQAKETDEGVELTITNTAYTNSGASNNVQKVLVKNGEEAAPEVFIATYGETAYADIRAAHDAGKMCFCVKQQSTAAWFILPLVLINNTNALFCTVRNSTIMAKNVTSNNIWVEDQDTVLFSTGGTMTGPLTLAGDPTENLHAATKRYVDTHAGGAPEVFVATYGETLYEDIMAAHNEGQLCVCIYNGNWHFGAVFSSTVRFTASVAGQAVRVVTVNGFDTWEVSTQTLVKKDGDSMTGYLTLHADPTNAMHAATKQYVDSKLEENVELLGNSLPIVNETDNGKFLRVVNGAWAAAALESAEGGSF